MKKPQKFQVRCWPFVREFSKPVRFVVLGNGATIALMEENGGDAWCIFSKDAKGKLDNSLIYAMPGVRDVIFHELIDQLAGPEKERLANAALNPTLTIEKRVEAAKELGRLEIADDEKYDGLMAQAEQFVATHTLEEQEAEVGRLVAKADELRAEEES